MQSKSKRIEFQLPLKMMDGHELSKSVRTESTASDNSREDSFCYAFKQGVRFDLHNTTVRTIEDRASMTKEERQASWYNRESYGVISRSIDITMQLMMIGRENPEQYGLCYRGLESRLPENRNIIMD